MNVWCVCMICQGLFYSWKSIRNRIMLEVQFLQYTGLRYFHYVTGIESVKTNIEILETI